MTAATTGADGDGALSVRMAAEQAPNRVALIERGEEITFGELAQESMAWVTRLRRGSWLESVVGEDPVLAVVGHSDRSTLACLLGLMEIAEPFLLLHPRLTGEERSELVSMCGVQRILDVTALGSGQEPSPSPVGSAEAVGQTSEARIDRSTTLAMLHTSGTTGRPRVVRLSRRAVLASARASAANLGWREDDRWLLSLPVAHVGGLSILTRCLVARRAVVLQTERSFSPQSLTERVESDRVTLLSLVPTMLYRMLELEPAWQPPAFLRGILVGGAAASPALLDRAVQRGWPVLTTYGMTETCSQIATQRLGTTQRGEAGSGPPLEGFEVEIAGAQGTPLVRGAIRVRGEPLFDGYVDRSGSQEAAVFDEAGWFDTGDLGFFDAAGHLHVLGRAGEMIVSGGENVSPLEVEAALESHPGIDRAAVFGMSDPEWGERVAAALVAVAEPVAEADVRAFLSSRLAGFKHPRTLVWLDALPLTPGGKLDREAVRRRFGSP